MKVTIHCVEFCLNDIGVWNKSWHLTKREATAEFKRLKDEEGCDPKLDDGSYGSIIKPKAIEVELTAAGILAFANNYAVDAGC